ncbi:MAG: hypothetical protein R3D33_11070 [Hyphomicrobiaceae bacterium]
MSARNRDARASAGAAGRSTLAAVIVTLALAGCGMGSMGSLTGGLLGQGSTASTDAPAVSEESLLSAAKTDADADATSTTMASLASAASTCPQFFVDSDEREFTSYEAGRDGDGLAIMHRGEITQTARECQLAAGQMTVKYGFSGRVLLGPKGQAGSIALPVTVFVTDAEREKIATDDVNISVDVPAGRPIGYFSTVRTVTFPLPDGVRPADYKIFVGFRKPAKAKG